MNEEAPKLISVSLYYSKSRKSEGKKGFAPFSIGFIRFCGIGLLDFRFGFITKYHIA
jgi:hypothetical protein